MKLPVATLVSLAFTPLAFAGAPDLPANAFPSAFPKSPEAALATFDLDPDFRIELVAAEPLIADPVAISFDENGVLYVCEMRDYSERREEKLGRISRLEDRDADGRMDHATVFAEGLPWPTGVLCYGGGVFVMAVPDLWFFKDTDGDGVADERRVVLMGFSELATRLNVQQLPNSLRWGPDQRVHLAEGGNGSRVRRLDQKPDEGLVLRGRDLSFNPRTLELRAESGGGQYGMAFDDYGRKFVSSNSRHLLQIAYDINLLGDSPTSLPPPAVDIAGDGPAAPVFRRSPDEAWRVIRTRWRVSGISPGLIEGGGVPSGYFTGATGLQIARGDRLGRPNASTGGYGEDAFVADTGSNLVHRKRLTPDGVLMRGERPVPNEHREFLASTDNWFRPVQIENGPSGGLYIVDFYREIIEHPWSLPPGIKEHLDLNRGNDRGRVWRIIKKASLTHRTVRLGDASTPELVALLGHENGWHRDTAARLLWERNDPVARALLTRAVSSPTPFARVGALGLLSARGELDGALLASGLRDASPGVRIRALKLAPTVSPPIDWNATPWREHALRLADSESESGRLNREVMFALALVVARGSPDQELTLGLWRKLATHLSGDELLQAAVVALVTPFASKIRSEFLEIPVSVELAVVIAERAARSMGVKQATSLLLERSADTTEDYLDLSLATGIARVPELTKHVALPPAFKDRLAREAAAFMMHVGQLQLAQPNGTSQNNPLAGVFKLVGPERAGRELVPMLDEPLSPAMKDAITEELLAFEESSLMRDLLAQWSQLTPRSRVRVFEFAQRQPVAAKLALERAQTSPEFAAQIGPAVRAALRQHADQDVRARAIAIFGEASGATSSEQAQRYAPSLTLPGDAIRGRAIYQTRCASCHRAAGEGFDLGPDLLTVAAAGRESLLANILEPNREVAPRFEAWTAKLQDGEIVSGLLSAERPESVSIRVAGGVEQVVVRSSLTALASTGKSLMPEGLDEGLSAEAMADLLRFIESLAGPP